jgi:hypothetical protein
MFGQACVVVLGVVVPVLGVVVVEFRVVVVEPVMAALVAVECASPSLMPAPFASLT